MTVSSSNNRSGPYTADGIVTVFARTFKVLDADHLKVYQTIGTVTTEVTTGITKNNIDQDTGDVTFMVAPISGSQITLIREVPLTQESDYSNEGTVPPEQVEADFDKQAMIQQDLSEKVGRAYIAPIVGFSFTDGNVVIFDSTGALADGGASVTALVAAAQTATDAAAAAAQSAVEAATFNPALYFLLSNNFSDIPDLPTAQNNLGLMTGAFTQKADQATSEAGVDDTRFMTPLGTKQQVDQRLGNVDAGVLLQTVVASDDGNIKLFNVFDAVAFWGYTVRGFSILPSVDNEQLEMVTSGSNFALPADQGVNDYGYAMTNPRDGSGLGQLADNFSSEIIICNGVGNGAGQAGDDFEVSFKEPQLLRNTYFRIESQYEASSNNWRCIDGGGLRRAAAVVDGLQFQFGSGNISSGTFQLIGHPRLT